MELSSAYDPKATEDHIYKLWEESGFFNPNNLQLKNLKPKNFTILLPPPNITGSLHMGHALNAVISDTLIRYHRMKGETAVWLPGVDHAGIATQNVVEKQLKKEGETRFGLGREKFIERVWKWKKQSGETILHQLKKIGASCDFSRARFTIDPAYARAVTEAFVHYHKKGLLYRAQRTVNWCVRCETSISDLEVEYKEENAMLYYIQYGPCALATARPETKFGDTALAVHPNDKRYKKYIGKEIDIESLNTDGALDKPTKRVIQVRVVGDTAVDPGFGTGVIKVTPAHDITDYEIAARHDLPLRQVIDEHGRMNETAGKYQGMKVKEAREKITADLDAVGLLIKKEPYRHNIAVCSRCGSAIEPLPSWQWFLTMKELAEKSAKTVKSGATKIIPHNFEKVYFDWLHNIRDWCVSRQLWWGHQLPVFFCKRKQEEFSISPPSVASGDLRQASNFQFSIKGENKNTDDNYIVALEKPAQCPFCKKCIMEQSGDVLDTWFSSALWPFAGLSKEDVAQFYPSSVLITARDIINLWVGRMIFSGLEFKGETPFPAVFIHPTVLTKDGKRMSKSLGTGIDPLDLINRYGADATRFGIIWQAMGAQDIHFDETAVVAGKKFANKVWNASRFVLKQSGEPFVAPQNGTKNGQDAIKKPNATTEENKKILAQLEKTKKEVERFLETYQFGQALHALYDFFWHDYCDVYLETVKKEGGDETLITARAILEDSLKILHPFMPFITEALYEKLYPEEKKLLMVEAWPR